MLLNRRHLRIKTLQILYAFSQHERADFLWAKKELFKSLDKMYEMYLLLLQVFPEIERQAIHRIEENKKKILPKKEDLSPNLKFVNNQIIRILVEHHTLSQESKNLKVNWENDEKQELMRKLFNQIRESETFFEFMNNGKTGFEEDKEFAVQLFKTEIANSNLLLDFLDDKSIYWADDIDLICSMVIKTMREFKEINPDDNESNTINIIFPLFKSDDDEKEFVTVLLREAVKNREKNLKLIDSLTQNWELDRIAKMDVLLMELAITELTSFNNIPTKVTLNEYIEISKFYSTPKSSVFINGILDKAIISLKKEDKIKKVGRGLLK